MRVETWMTPDPIRTDPDASALTALEAMVDNGIRHLPVVSGAGDLVGILTLDDLRAALPFEVTLRRYPSQVDQDRAREYTVGELMTHAPRVARRSAPLEEAVHTLARWRIGCLPVVDGGRKLVGLFSETDALRALVEILNRKGTGPPKKRTGGSDALVRSLRAERWRILQQLRARADMERELSADRHDAPMDDAERGSDLQAVELTEQLADLAARRLAAISRALDRAAQGTFGVCESCGKRIPVGRLRALPGTTRCVLCAEKEGPAEPAVETRERFFETPPLPGRTVHTEAGEGRLLRLAPFGSCGSCGEVEGTYDDETDEVVCASPGCGIPLSDVEEQAVVQVGEEILSVPPEGLRPVDPSPFD
jgi:RNA polymerase-binding transcription factor DksA/predicted transcriptional regulator